MPEVPRWRMPVQRFRPSLNPTAAWADPRGAHQGALLEQQNWATWHDQGKGPRPPAAPRLLRCQKSEKGRPERPGKALHRNGSGGAVTVC